jgi:hypothetical protein
MVNEVHSIIRDEITKGGLKNMWLIEGIRKILRNRKRDREIMVLLERRREELEKQGEMNESSEDKEIRIFKNRSEGQTRRRTRESLQQQRGEQ